MRIAILQGPAEPGTKADALALLARTAEDVAARGARLLVASEMFLTGYAIGREAVAELAEPVDGPSMVAAAEIARRNGLGLVYGYPERASDGAIYNAAILIGPEGDVRLNYRKIHLFGDLDRDMFAAGTEPGGIAEIDGVRIGLLICYDVEFPEAVRLRAMAGADLIAIPTALMQPWVFVPRQILPVRAFENQVYIAYANRTGAEASLVYTGESVIAGPDCRNLVHAGPGDEVLLADLDMEALARSRTLYPYLADRRPAIYAQGMR
jgi:predicted amidohydrolase